jgi:hypothetical protein
MHSPQSPSGPSTYSGAAPEAGLGEEEPAASDVVETGSPLASAGLTGLDEGLPPTRAGTAGREPVRRVPPDEFGARRVPPDAR